MIGQQIQHYRVVRRLGAGGMGVVYEATDTRLGRHVALKFLPETPGLSPAAAERFEQEARIASSLNHQNICTIYDVGVHGDQRFIVMELLDGESLRSRIHGQPLPIDLVLDVGCQIADALDVAHASGIVHRDIKPANIFITKRGLAKLLDFGIAKLEAEPADTGGETRAGDGLTVSGTAMGSINYMSPEQARGEPLDARTDLFSLGLVLYEMATGRQAFSGQTSAIVFDAILNRQPPDARQLNADLPEELQRVLARSLEKDRRMRFQTAADMQAELGRIRRDTSGRTGAAGVLPPTITYPRAASGVSMASGPSRVPLPSEAPAARGTSRSRWLTIGALAIVAALAAGYFVWKPTRPAVLTEKDTVLIADFANTTGDPVFDDALRQAVAVQLQQTPFLSLLPDQRVQWAMRLMQRPPDEAVVRTVAREVCQRAGAKATVEGSIAPLGSSYVVTLGVHNCQTGETLAQQQVQASRKEDVLNQLGAAVTTLRQHLGESLASIQKYDVPMTDATTTSLEALKAYGQALKTRATKGEAASVPFFRQALERDPNFALAYAKLGVVLANQGQAEEAKKYALKAYELHDKVSEYERLYINWNYASRVLQDQKAAKEALELLIAAYPRDYAARNNLGVYYNSRGEFEDALEQYKAASEIAPEEPAPISNAAYAALFLGRNDEAYTLVDRALALRPDSSLAVARWTSAVMENDARAAAFEKAAATIATEDQMLSSRASLVLWHGKLKGYDQIVETMRARALAANNKDGAVSLNLSQHITHAAYLDGAHVAALVKLTGGIPNPAPKAQIAAVLAMIDELATARAMLPALLKDAASNQSVKVPLAIVQAYAKAADGQPKEGEAILDAVLAEQPRALDLHYCVGHIRETNGDVDGAIASYQTVIKARAFLGANAAVTASRLALAKLLVKKGDTAAARKELDTLLAQWKDADIEFPMLTQAKEERAKIK
jgi:eukaryotic-like serine/threonine-protein kinase